MLEGEYLELVDDLKKRFEKKEEEMNGMKERISYLEKDLLTAFGMIRMIDYFCSLSDTDEELKVLISSLRTYLSECFDNVLYNGRNVQE